VNTSPENTAEPENPQNLVVVDPSVVNKEKEEE